jgi:hypothetical protein
VPDPAREPDVPGPEHRAAPELAARIAANVARVRERVGQAAADSGRDPASVRLLVATKMQPRHLVRAAVACGIDLIGENRVQELVAKAPDLADLVAHGRVRAHLIGHLQSNKVNAVVGLASCVESVDSLALAERLSRRAVTVDEDLDVMVQVNVSGEATKSGVPPEHAADLAVSIGALPRLHLTGFMTIGARSGDDTTVRRGFARLRGVRDDVGGLTPGTVSARELSMGMSGDLELAIAEGATVVRVGSAIFGSRPTAHL